MKLTMFQTLVVRVQHEVLEATGDVVIGQELQVILIKLKLQRVLLQNLQGYKKTERDSWREWRKVRVCATAGSHPPRMRQERTSPVLLKAKVSDIITARHNPD